MPIPERLSIGDVLLEILGLCKLQNKPGTWIPAAWKPAISALTAWSTTGLRDHPANPWSALEVLSAVRGAATGVTNICPINDPELSTKCTDYVSRGVAQGWLERCQELDPIEFVRITQEFGTK